MIFKFAQLLSRKLGRVAVIATHRQLKVNKRALCRSFISVSKMPVKGLKESWDFSLTPDELHAKTDALIDRCRKTYSSIGEINEENITVENVLEALNQVEGDLLTEFLYLSFPQHVATDKELRDASNKAEIKLQEFIVEIGMREDIFQKLLVLEKKKEELDPKYKRYLEFLIKQGKRNGLHLSKETQDEMRSIKNKINELCSQFAKNLNESNTTIEATDEDLDGLPEDFIKELQKTPDSGKRIITMKYPHYFPIMGKARNPEMRKRMLFAFNTQCMKENSRILEEIVPLRQKCAELLGFPNFASYATDICHAKTAENVLKFLSELAAKLHPQWLSEKAKMLEIKAKECAELNIPNDGKLNDYDLRYYSNKVKELYYNVDEEKVRNYFPLPVVTQALLDIYQKLLGLTFKEMENPSVWHPDVRMFSVEDSGSGDLLGYFFLDLFPREGKYGHAALFPLQIPYVRPDGTRMASLGAMVANMTKPTAEKPSLLTHSEVTTYFHEFGHVMHQMCLKSDIVHFNNIEELDRDFVETPSQMLEEWCWEPLPLRLLSSHYIDQQPMPDDMIKSLIRSRLANTAGFILRQIVLATFDQRLHTRGQADTQSLYRDTQIEFLGISPLEGTNFVANFSHLCNKYEAQYYGYLWSEVFSKDMFWTRFKDGNILNPEVGKEYRRKVLEVGAARDVSDILRDFIGRDPNQNAFLLSRGLKVD